MTSLLFIILLGLLTFLHITSRYSRKGLLVDKLPGPVGYPIFGNVLMLINKSLGEKKNYNKIVWSLFEKKIEIIKI